MTQLRQPDLILEFLGPDRAPARAVSELGIAGLDHKAFDYPVEDAVIIIAVLCVGEEVLAGFWTFLWVDLNVDFTHGGVYTANDGLVVKFWSWSIWHHSG